MVAEKVEANMKILVAYDGTLQAKKAISYGISRVREAGGELTVLQVFERGLFTDYDAGPSAEAAARCEAAARLEEAKRILSEEGGGVPAALLTSEGDPIVVLQERAAAEHPDLLIAPKRFKALLRSAPCPVMLTPGAVLVPIDSSGSAADPELIVRETLALGGPALLLGIVPVHLFGQEEKAELEQVRGRTEAALKRTSDDLKQRGVKTQEVLAAGYPDEEIIKAAKESEVSLILLPSGGTTPSELSKAGEILKDESSGIPWPLLLVPAQ
jgi:nucleotide-binding universal stress UspA family protein